MHQSGVQDLDIEVSVQHHGLAFSSQTEPLMLCASCTLWLIFGSLRWVQSAAFEPKLVLVGSCFSLGEAVCLFQI